MSAASVLHVVDDLTVGGVQRLVVDLDRAHRAGGALSGICARGRGPLHREVEDEGGRMHRLPAGTGPTARVRQAQVIRRSVRAKGYEVVHAHGRALALVSKVAMRGLGVPVVEHVHNQFSATRVGRLLSFRSDVVIACGSAVAQMLIEDFRVPADRVRLVLNGVRDPGAPSPPASVSDPGPLRILGIGGLTEAKNPERFVDVVAQAASSGMAVTARWAGGGEVERLRAYAARRGVATQVEFMGAVPDVTHLIRDCHVVLMTSRHEGLPLAALEAIANARPVVLPDVGSCSDLFAAGTPGVLYRSALAETDIVELLSGLKSNKRLLDLSREARRVYESQFDFVRMVGEIEEIYRRALLDVRGSDRARR